MLADPLRLRLIEAFAGRERSIKEAAERLGMAPGKLYYHVDLLERHGLLTVASTRVVSGITEKRYRAVAKHLRVDRALLAAQEPDAALDAMLGAALDATREAAETATRTGALQIGGEDEAFVRKIVRLSAGRSAAFRAEIAEIFARYDDPSPDAAGAYNLTFVYFPIERPSP